MKGSEVEEYLVKCAYAQELKRDNNEYLVSFKLDTGVEIAFDPRVKGKKGREASIFITHLPLRLMESGGISLAETYPPETPSTALGRVSKTLADTPIKYRVRVLTHEALGRLIEWIRWA